MSEPKMPPDYRQFMADLSARTGVEIDTDEAWEFSKERIVSNDKERPDSP